jgi:serine/threonine protein kinase
MKKIRGTDFLYFTNEKIGSGSFSNVFKGKNMNTSEDVAVKVENKLDGINTLPLEYYYHKKLSQYPLSSGIPTLHGYYTDIKNNYIVTQLLGFSLGQIKNKIDQSFDEYSVKNVGKKAVVCIEYIHKCGILHRDIKPDNIVLDNNYKKLYIIDFGLSKEFKKNERHIPLRIKASPTGTLRYMSHHCSNLMEVSRRDDLISLGYVLVYLLKGSLPWQGTIGLNKSERYKNVAKKKMKTSIEELCNGCPKFLFDYMKYCYNLEFEDTPNYSFLEKLFTDDS